jgi:pimeloyl-ACP methyl ester carboxylesterase
MTRRPLVLIHGWSDSSKSFVNLARFLEQKLKQSVTTIDLADWVSMDDTVSYRDISFAMNRAWKKHRLPKTPGGADVVTHSTGALVVRQWMTDYFRAGKVPIKHFLMLAPANFGSPLAHKGRAFYGRILKGWNNAFQTGTKILKGLELGSPYTWQLAEKDLFSRARWYGAQGILATVLVGNTGYKGVRAAANEDGSDGTVRISTANLNAVKMNVDYARNPHNPWMEITDPSIHNQTAFAILDGDTHASITMDGKSTPRNTQARDLFVDALSVKETQWKQWCAKLDRITKNVEKKAKPGRKYENHCYQNTVVRVTNNLGEPVNEYFLEFYESDSDRSTLAAFFHRKAIRTVHTYSSDQSYRSIYVDTTLLNDRIDKKGESLDISLTAHPEFENGRTNAGYRTLDKKDMGAIRIPAKMVGKVFVPNRTLLVDIVIRREVSEKVFALTPLNP